MGDEALDELVDDLLDVGGELLGVPAGIANLDGSVGRGTQLEKCRC